MLHELSFQLGKGKAVQLLEPNGVGQTQPSLTMLRVKPGQVDACEPDESIRAASERVRRS